MFVNIRTRNLIFYYIFDKNFNVFVIISMIFIYNYIFQLFPDIRIECSIFELKLERHLRM